VSEHDYKKEILIKTRTEKKNIRLVISDNGMGIRAKDLDRIFDPFFTTKLEGFGTGLGLSLVYGIIKEMQGEIKVSSKAGEYTKFEILFPRFPEND